MATILTLRPGVDVSHHHESQITGEEITGDELLKMAAAEARAFLLENIRYVALGDPRRAEILSIVWGREAG